MTSFPTASWNLLVETVSMESEFAGTSQSFQAIESAGEWARRTNARLGFWGKILELQILENQVAFFFGSCVFGNEKRFGTSHWTLAQKMSADVRHTGLWKRDLANSNITALLQSLHFPAFFATDSECREHGSSLSEFLPTKTELHHKQLGC